jgi:hypothetical protein
MTEPTEMIAWLDRRINSVTMWLSDHGRTSKKPRTEHEILIKEEDLAMFEEIKRAYSRALDNRRASA